MWRINYRGVTIFSLFQPVASSLLHQVLMLHAYVTCVLTTAQHVTQHDDPCHSGLPVKQSEGLAAVGSCSPPSPGQHLSRQTQTQHEMMARGMQAALAAAAAQRQCHQSAALDAANLAAGGVAGPQWTAQEPARRALVSLASAALQ